MVLPPQISFRSAKATDPDDNFGYFGGYHVQYEINSNIVNIVILPMQNVVTKPLPEEEQFLDKLDQAAIVSDDEDRSPSIRQMDLLDQIEDEIQEWIESKCESTLLQLVRSTKSRSKDSETTLKTLLSPSIINLQLKTIDGHVAVIRHDDVPPWPKDWHLGQPFGLAVQLPIDAKVTRHDASEIVVVEKHAVPIVTIKHQDLRLRCKLNINAQSTLREYNIYRDLAKLNANHELGVPAFYGCVTDGDGSEVVALLIEDIQVQFPTLEHAMGRFVDDDAVDADILRTNRESAKPIAVSATGKQLPIPLIDRRKKWAHQIRKTMQILHENDIVWGDVKPANIVIDVKDDAWAVDFGGGFTRPWKLPADAEAMLGDLSALRLIEEYLETGKEPPMLEECCDGVDRAIDEEIDDNRVEAAATTMQSQTPSLTHEEEKACNTKRKHRSCSPV